MTATQLLGAIRAGLASVPVSRPCCRAAEAAVMFRFAGGLYLDDGQVVAEAVLERAAARRLQAIITEIFGLEADCRDLPGPGQDGASGSVVRASEGERLALRAGLLSARGRVILGLPPQVVGGSRCDSEAVWRGAVLAAGTVTGAGLVVTCPGWEAGMALTGAARRLRIPAQARRARHAEQVIVRQQAAIGLLTRIGADKAARAWDEHLARREARAPGSGSAASLGDANLGRSTRAARIAAARAERALEILGDTVPSHLAIAGWLRAADRACALEKLGQAADPPLSKHAIAGRLRRLYALADRRAAEQGIPGTSDPLLAWPP